MLKSRMVQVAIVIIVLGAVFLFVNQKNEKPTRKVFITEVSPTDVVSFSFTRVGELDDENKEDKKDADKTKKEKEKSGEENRSLSFAYDKELKQWTLAGESGTQAIADISKIVAVFDFLNEVVIIQRVTQKEKQYPKFDVGGAKGTQLKLNFHNKKDPLVIYLGRTGVNHGQFVRKKTDPYVYLLKRELRVAWDQEDWYYKQILGLPTKDLKSIAYNIKSKRNKIVLNYDATADELKTQDKMPKGKRLKKLDDVLRNFKGLRVKSYVGREAEKVRLTSQVEHELTMLDGTILNLNFLKARKKKKKDSDQFFLDISVKAGTTAVGKYFDQLTKVFLFELKDFNTNQWKRDLANFFEKIPGPKEEKKKDVTKGDG